MKSESHRIIYRGDKVPLFQSKLYETESAALQSPMIDIVIAQNRNSGLVENVGFDYGLMKYDQDYNNDQSQSLVFQNHLSSVSKLITELMPRFNFLEIGCGKGKFMEFLEAKGCTVFGYDPSYTGNKKNIVKNYYSGEYSCEKTNVVMRHVLEHIPNPIKFLEGIKGSCKSGYIYIEVPSLEWIIKNNSWYDFTGEHCNYFTLDFFHSIFEKIIFSEFTFGSQYISIIADLDSLRSPEIIAEKVEVPNTFGPPSSFDSYSGDFNFVWGAAGKGVIFCNLASRAGLKIANVVDINPDKVGKRIPGTGHLVSGPHDFCREKNGNIFVMNRVYLDEIRALCGDSFNFILV